jgi:signal transduction histidine kinase
MVEAHSGRIGLDNIQGEGLTFWLEMATSPAD